VKILIYKLLLVSVLFPSASFAGISSGTGKITQLNVIANGTRMMIRFSQPIQNPENCEGADFYVYEFTESNPADKFYAAVLAAYTSQADISFWISGCTTSQHWGATRPKPFDIYMN
jgi:hypothetical protein